MDVLRAAASNIPGVITGGLVFLALIGFIVVFMGFWQLHSQRSVPNAHYPKAQLFMVFWGGIMISFVYLVEVLSVSLFNDATEARSMLSYSPTSVNTSTEVMFDALLAFTRVVGFWAIGKGMLNLLSLMRGNTQDNSAGRIIVLLFFGAALANILEFTDVLAASIGMQNFLRNFV